jgi:hypothetical protein
LVDEFGKEANTTDGLLGVLKGALETELGIDLAENAFPDFWDRKLQVVLEEAI